MNAQQQVLIGHIIAKSENWTILHTQNGQLNTLNSLRSRAVEINKTALKIVL